MGLYSLNFINKKNININKIVLETYNYIEIEKIVLKEMYGIIKN